MKPADFGTPEATNYLRQADAAAREGLRAGKALQAFADHAKTCELGCVLIDDSTIAACPEGTDLAVRAAYGALLHRVQA